MFGLELNLNTILLIIFVIYLWCLGNSIRSSDDIKTKQLFWQKDYFKLGMLIFTVVVYKQNKQAGIIFLVMTMITHLGNVRERFQGSPNQKNDLSEKNRQAQLEEMQKSLKFKDANTDWMHLLTYINSNASEKNDMRNQLEEARAKALNEGKGLDPKWKTLVKYLELKKYEDEPDPENKSIGKARYDEFMNQFENTKNKNAGILSYVEATEEEKAKMLDNVESNYHKAMKKIKTLEEIRAAETKRVRNARLEDLKKDELITPLEAHVIGNIQNNFGSDLTYLLNDSFEALTKHTVEGDPENAGLIDPKTQVDPAIIDYSNLIKLNQVIDF